MYSSRCRSARATLQFTQPTFAQQYASRRRGLARSEFGRVCVQFGFRLVGDLNIYAIDLSGFGGRAVISLG
ncbi:unnamed protein product [Sphagnum balticum]